VVEIAAKLGAGVIGLNPLHAASLSPYSPSSRHALNPLYIALDAAGPGSCATRSSSTTRR
jgi:4-alpha-glucanotransferase